MAPPKNTSVVLTPNTHKKIVPVANPNVALIIVVGVIVPALIACGLGTISETIVIAMVIAVIAVVVMIAQPFWGLVVFTGLLYTRPEESIPVLAGMHFTMLVEFIALTGMLLHMMLKRVPLVSNSFLSMLTGFTICALLSAAVAGTFSAAVIDFTRLFILVLLILNLVRTPERYESFVITLIVFTVYLSLYSIYLFSIGFATIDSGIIQGLARSKGTGIFSDPNDLAAAIVSGVALALSQMVQKHGATRAIYLLLASIMIGATLLTYSRGGLLALITVIGGFCLLNIRRKTLALGAAALLIGAALIAAPGRMKSFDSNETSAHDRFEFWKEGISQLKLHPLTGVGYQQFVYVNNGVVAHNSFVHCFAELGFVAYFFWMGGIYLAFHKRTLEAQASDTVAGDARQLAGARLALMGHLAAVFWISRTYSPILFILICLPISQQIAVCGQQKLILYTHKEKWRVQGRIFAFSCVMLIIILIMVQGK